MHCRRLAVDWLVAAPMCWRACPLPGQLMLSRVIRTACLRVCVCVCLLASQSVYIIMVWQRTEC